MTLQYDPPGTRCAGGPQPGAVALLAYALARWPLLASWGIYNCRPARGSTKLSLHGEGRAVDLHPPTHGDALGWEVARWAVAELAPRGWVQEVVWDDHQWSARFPAWRARVDPATGAAYRDPTLGHRDHVHVGLSWFGARELRRAMLDGLPSGATPPPPPTVTVEGPTMPDHLLIAPPERGGYVLARLPDGRLEWLGGGEFGGLTTAREGYTPPPCFPIVDGAELRRLLVRAGYPDEAARVDW